MKTLNKPEVILTLMILVVYLLLGFLGDHIFPFVYTYINEEYVHFIHAYRTHFFITAVAILIFFTVRFYHRKISTLEEQYSNFFEGNPMPMSIVDLDSQKFVAANKAAIDTYGYSRKELLELTIADIRVKEESELMHHDLQTINHGLKKAGIRQHRKKNGEIIIVELSSSQIIFKNKKCRLLLARNITEITKAREEKRIAEKEKMKQESFTSYVIENFPVDVAIFDKEHRYILLNKTAVKNDEMRKWMIGKDDFEYFALKGVDMSIAEKRRERFLNAIAGDSKEWIDKHIVDGKEKYMLRKFYPYYEDGELKYVYGYGMDITEVKKAQMQRDEYIGQLEKIAYTTSHKIRQPICNLQGLISLFEMEELESREVRNIISCMQNSVSTLDDFTRDLAVKLHEYKQNLSKQDNDTKF